jgi:hypothetical protein
MTCTASPWAGITSPPPSTILLPGGWPRRCARLRTLILGAPS